ncbi:DMT family transporter [Namhaeicola litoreus]|uniref:DMT family transporter n=1 Tax=Namhaeicola litoreus TaxID=1052145 RepID=A0ABW3XYN9_9FLAO
MNEKQLRWFYLITLSLIWGSSFILMKKALIGLSPLQVGALRISIAAIFLSLIGIKKLKEIESKEWKYLILSAFCGTFFPVFLFIYAVYHIDSSIASILNSLTPLNTLIIGVLFFGVAFIKKQFLGILVGLTGAVLLILKGSEINPDQNYFYALFIILASVGYGLNVNLVKKHLSNVNATTITISNFVFLLIPSLIVLFYSGFFEITFNKDVNISLVYVSLLSIVCTALANILFYKMVHISSPIFASSVTYLIPLVAIFWGIMDGEHLTILQLLFGTLIIFGVYLINSAKK